MSESKMSEGSVMSGVDANLDMSWAGDEVLGVPVYQPTGPVPGPAAAYKDVKFYLDMSGNPTLSHPKVLYPPKEVVSISDLQEKDRLQDALITYVLRRDYTILVRKIQLIARELELMGSPLANSDKEDLEEMGRKC